MINSDGSYQPLRPRQLDYQEVRDRRYALHCWPGSGDAIVFLLHGYGDCAPAFEMLVDHLPSYWTVIAPDWRGFGASTWNDFGYWFPDYLADLDTIIEMRSNAAPVNLIGHSMGGNVAGLYAGIRPPRVARLAVLDGFGVPDTVPEQAPDRYAKWLIQIRQQQPSRVYKSIEELARGISRRYPELTPEMALFAAAHWAVADGTGGWKLKSDPTHRWTNPILYRRAEAMACWQRITAPVLLCNGEVSRFAGDADQVAKILMDSGNNDVANVVLPNVGHMLHLQAPRQCAEILTNFFQEIKD